MNPETTPRTVLPDAQATRELGDTDAVIVALGLWIAVLAAYVGETSA